jgi:Ca2+-binding RTX toxin-like protein
VGRRANIGLVAALAALAVAQPAAASTIRVIDQPGLRPSLHFSAAENEANRVTIAQELDHYVVTDTGAPLTADPPCQSILPNRAHCPLRENVMVGLVLGDGDDLANVHVPSLYGGASGGPGNDEITLPGDVVSVNGEEGDDRLKAIGPDAYQYGGPGNDRIEADGVGQTIAGEDGDDVLVGHDASTAEFPPSGQDCYVPGGAVEDDGLDGGPGNDVLDGRGGYDSLIGREGNDRLDGGPGCDRMFGEGVFVPEGPDSGPPGEDVLDGGDGRDELHGGPGGDRLEGGPENDRLDGGPSADAMTGGDGADLVLYVRRTAPVTATLNGVADDGEAGEGDLIGADVERVDGGHAPDLIVGNGGANQFNGNGGDDTLLGGGGLHDQIYGGAGNDLIDTRDGTSGPGWDDEVLCDWGSDPTTRSDVALLDRADTGATGCENVVYSLNAVDVKREASAVRVKAPCLGGDRPDCTGTAVLQLPRPKASKRKFAPDAARQVERELGRASFRAKPGKPARVRVKLSASARKLVRRSGGVRALTAFRYRR